MKLAVTLVVIGTMMCLMSKADKHRDSNATPKHQWYHHITGIMATTIEGHIHNPPLLAVFLKVGYVMSYKLLTSCASFSVDVTISRPGSPCGRMGVSKRGENSLSYSWRMDVNQLFHINLTFSTFQLSYSVHNCINEQIMLAESTQSPNKSFCGWRHPWSQYIADSHQEVKFLSAIPSHSQFSLVYSVIQKDGVTQHKSRSPLASRLEIIKLIHTINVPGLERVYFVLYLRVPLTRVVRFQVLLRECMDGKVTVFDGPSSRGTATIQGEFGKRSGAVYRSTGFFMTITVDGKNTCTPTESVRLSLGASANQIKLLHVKINETSGSELSLPSSACQHRSTNLQFCLVTLSVPPGMYIHVHVSEVSFPHPNTADCRFGGLQFRPIGQWNARNTYLTKSLSANNDFILSYRQRELDIIHGHLTEMWDPPLGFCNRQYLVDGSTGGYTLPFSSFTTRRNFVHFAFYSYMPETNPQAKISFTQSTCQGIQLRSVPVHIGSGVIKTEHLPFKKEPVINPEKVSAPTDIINNRYVDNTIALPDMCEATEMVELRRVKYSNRHEELIKHSHTCAVYDIRDERARLVLSYSDTRKEFVNAIYPYPDTECLSIIQRGPTFHWYTSHYVTENPELYKLYIQTYHPRVTTTYVHQRVAPGCQMKSNLTKMPIRVYSEVSHSQAHYITSMHDSYDPSCGYFILDVAVNNSYIGTLSGEFSHSLKNAHVDTYVSGAFALNHLHHQWPLPGRDRDKSAVISHYDMSQYKILSLFHYSYHLVHSTMFDSQLYAALYYSHRYRTLLTLTLTQIPDHVTKTSCKRICVNVEILVQNRSPFFSHVYHSTWLELNIPWGQSFTIHNFIIMEQRHVVISPSKRCVTHPTCSLKVTINPLASVVKSSLKKYKRIVEDLESDILDGTTFFVFHGPHSMSWEKAESMCVSLGGHLTSMTSEDERSLLESMLMGATFKHKSSDAVYSSHCRQYDSLCTTFIGIRRGKVYRPIYIFKEIFIMKKRTYSDTLMTYIIFCP